mmetsp:Transcript_29575/g.73963  ORF Transcript_29575/g.73963 Transcript_29575/m.73963 type:complete len:214 (-) Transcript_29575:442-1083(-)
MSPPRVKASEGRLRFAAPLWSSATACGCCWLTAEGPAVLPPLVATFAAAGGFGALGFRGTGAIASTTSDWQCSITSAGTGSSLGGAHIPSAPEHGKGCRRGIDRSMIHTYGPLHPGSRSDTGTSSSGTTSLMWRKPRIAERGSLSTVGMPGHCCRKSWNIWLSRGTVFAGACAATQSPELSCGSLIFHVLLSCVRLRSRKAEQNGCLRERARR